MYLVVFSNFYKLPTDLNKINSDWNTLYSLNCNVVICSASNLSKFISLSFDSINKVEKKNTFPLCVHKFKSPEEINNFRKHIICIKKIMNCKFNDNKRFTICQDSTVYSIKTVRLLKVLINVEPKETIVMELNSLTLSTICILKEYLDKNYNTTLFKEMRACDKYMLKYIRPDKDKFGLYSLKDKL